MNRLAAGIAAPLLLAAVVGAQIAVDSRPEKKEMVAANPFHKLPPSQYMGEYTASMLLGGLRAVAIDYLWIQFMKAERARQWIEVNALLEIISNLEPSFSEIWNHLAWARAYNIAAAQETREDRWLWVKGGLESMDKAILRNPGSDKLWFYKGYMHYHRLPQEQYLMDEFYREKGEDSYGVAAMTLAHAIEIAQARGQNNTTPPSDGMMQDAFNKWAFVRMRRGDYRKAASTLQQGHDTYFRLMRGRPITDMNQKNNQLFLDLLPVFAVEETLAGQNRAGDPAAAQTAAKLLEMYVALEQVYTFCQGIEKRIVELTVDSLSRAFELARQGRAQEGADFFEKTAGLLYETLAGKTRGGAQQFWMDLGGFVRGVAKALSLEAEGKPAEAAAKYDDIIEIQRNVLPGDAPQWTLLKQRAAELRGQ